MSTDNLHRRIDRLIGAIERQRQPRIIDCTGAREALLAKLAHMHDQSGQDQDTSSPLLPGWLDNLRADLQQSVASIEETHNIRLVSREY